MPLPSKRRTIPTNQARIRPFLQAVPSSPGRVWQISGPAALTMISVQTIGETARLVSSMPEIRIEIQPVLRAGPGIARLGKQPAVVFPARVPEGIAATQGRRLRAGSFLSCQSPVCAGIRSE